MPSCLPQLYRYNAWANDDLLTQLREFQDSEALHTPPRLMNHTYVISRIFAGHAVFLHQTEPERRTAGPVAA